MMGAKEFADLGFLDLKKLFSCPPLMTTHDKGRSPPHNFYIGYIKTCSLNVNALDTYEHTD